MAHTQAEQRSLSFLSRTTDRICIFFYGNGVTCLLENHKLWQSLLNNKNIEIQICSNSYHKFQVEFDSLNHKNHLLFEHENIAITGLIHLIEKAISYELIINITNDDNFRLNPKEKIPSNDKQSIESLYLILRVFDYEPPKKKTIKRSKANQTTKEFNYNKVNDSPIEALQRTIDCYNLCLALNQKAKLVLPEKVLEYLYDKANKDKNTYILDTAIEFGLSELFLFNSEELINQEATLVDHDKQLNKSLPINIKYLHYAELNKIKAFQRHIIFN